MLVNGVEHYAYSNRPVEEEGSDERLLGATASAITDRDGNPVTPIDPTTLDPIDPFTTSLVNGLTPDCLLPVTGVWMTFGTTTLWIISDDVPELAQAAGDAAAAASSAASSAAQSAADAASTLALAQETLTDATAGAVRTISGGRDPIYSMFSDEVVPSGLAEGTLLIVKYRTAP